MKITPRRARWLSLLGSIVIRILGRTWRIRRHGPTPVDWRVVMAFLHGDILPVAYAFRGFGAAVMISLHGDGELIARVAERLGNHAVRGSSSRGGSRAFLSMARGQVARPWGITPDGPRGPRGRVHPGAVQLAASDGRPLIPLGVAFTRGWRLRSWDRFGIPAPFAKVILYLGDPLPVPRALDRETRDTLARALEAGLADAERAAQRLLTAREPQARWPARPCAGTRSSPAAADGTTPA